MLKPETSCRRRGAVSDNVAFIPPHQEALVTAPRTFTIWPRVTPTKCASPPIGSILARAPPAPILWTRKRERSGQPDGVMQP